MAISSTLEHFDFDVKISVLHSKMEKVPFLVTQSSHRFHSQERV